VTARSATAFSKRLRRSPHDDTWPASSTRCRGGPVVSRTCHQDDLVGREGGAGRRRCRCLSADGRLTGVVGCRARGMGKTTCGWPGSTRRRAGYRILSFRPSEGRTRSLVRWGADFSAGRGWRSCWVAAGKRGLIEVAVAARRAEIHVAERPRGGEPSSKELRRLLRRCLPGGRRPQGWTRASLAALPL